MGSEKAKTILLLPCDMLNLQSFWLWFEKYDLLSRNLKGGIWSLFDPCNNAMGWLPFWRSHMGWVIVPRCDLRTVLLPCVLPKCIRDLFLFKKGNTCLTNCLAGLATNYYGGTITHVHSDGKMAATTDYPFKFPCLLCYHFAQRICIKY